MKSKIPVVLILSILSVALALAQTSTNTASTASTAGTSTPVIFGHGTPNFIPIWTGGSTLGNSIVFQAGPRIGVRTTSPQATLDVESTFVSGIWGRTSSTEPFATGVYGQSASSTNGFGLSGDATATSGVTAGVFGNSDSTSGAGVNGNASAISGFTYGVFGRSSSTNGNGVFGYASAASGSTIGVSGFVESPAGTAGRFVAHSGLGLILQGSSGSNQTQVFSVDASGNGYFAGNLNVTGNVSKGSGSFKIDHPLDPANKYLSHSFVESPDMMNVYNGVVALDARGSAWVDLPDYFQTLNRDYRYQLTSIGAPGPNLYIAKEVSGNRFRISGGRPHAKVSWQVTGIRHDAYADANRIQVEEEKPANQRGTYLHPELFGGPATQTSALTASPGGPETR
jgi:hypothetical protein